VCLNSVLEPKWTHVSLLPFLNWWLEFCHITVSLLDDVPFWSIIQAITQFHFEGTTDHYVQDETGLGSFFPPLLQQFSLKYLLLISPLPPQIQGSTCESAPACSLGVCRFWVFPKVDPDTLKLCAHLCLFQSYFSPLCAPFSFSVASESLFLYHMALGPLPPLTKGNNKLHSP